MDWVPSHAALATHPKTKRLARLLGVEIPAAIGHLHLLWYFTADYTSDGDLTRFDTADLADVAQWKGDPDTFISALIECGPGDTAGFLERVDGHLTLHDFDEHIGRHMRRLEGTRQRAKAQAARNKDGTFAAPTRSLRVDNANTTRRLPATDRQTDSKSVCRQTSSSSECLDALQEITEYPFDEAKDLKLVGDLMKRHPRIDLPGEIVKWGTWLDDNPGRVKNYRSALRQWCDHAKPRPVEQTSEPSDVMFDTTSEEDWFKT